MASTMLAIIAIIIAVAAVIIVLYFEGVFDTNKSQLKIQSPQGGLQAEVRTKIVLFFYSVWMAGVPFTF